jgi:trehalose/maltose transport system substrate-binding protein
MHRLQILLICLAFVCCACGTGSPAVKFTARSRIDVDLIRTPGTSSQQLGPLLASLQKRVSTPDLFLVDVIWMGTLNRHLLDLRPYMDGQTRDYLPALLGDITIQNRVTGLPLYVSAGVLFYRADLLKKYGYDHPPGTWDDLGP